MKIARVVDGNDRTVHVARHVDGRLFRMEKQADGTMDVTDEEVEPVRWLPPVEPREIFCIGVNYSSHAKEFKHSLPEWPVVFMKNISAVTANEEAIRLPKVSEDEVDYEGELAVIIGKPCCNVVPEQALNFVLGYTIANDVTARIWQKEKGGGQWCRGKGFDTFCPMGPFLVTNDEIDDINDLTIETKVNGNVMQSGSTKNMIFSVAELISFLSQDTTLVPGTVILTGTPEGVGWARDPKVTLKSGDTVSITIEGFGTLTNKVKSYK